MNYNIDQILYVVFKKDHKIVPAQVSEEITRRTSNGLNIDYIVKIGSSDENQIPLSVLINEAEVFSSADEAVETLSNKAHISITKLVEAASEKAKVWYKTSSPTSRVMDEEVIHSVTREIEESVSVVLPDGTIARAKMPKAI